MKEILRRFVDEFYSNLNITDNELISKMNYIQSVYEDFNSHKSNKNCLYRNKYGILDVKIENFQLFDENKIVYSNVEDEVLNKNIDNIQKKIINSSCLNNLTSSFIKKYILDNINNNPVIYSYFITENINLPFIFLYIIIKKIQKTCSIIDIANLNLNDNNKLFLISKEINNSDYIIFINFELLNNKFCSFENLIMQTIKTFKKRMVIFFSKEYFTNLKWNYSNWDHVKIATNEFEKRIGKLILKN